MNVINSDNDLDLKMMTYKDFKQRYNFNMRDPECILGGGGEIEQGIVNSQTHAYFLTVPAKSIWEQIQ
ncbi:MAG: hypothetical protein QMC70_07630 [Bacteroidia bacterium]